MENLREIKVERRRNRSNVVKVGFSSTYKYVGTEDRNLRCNVSIGTNIIDQLCWKEHDYICALQSDNASHNNCIFFQKNNKKGEGVFTLQNVKKSYSYLISIPFFKEVKCMKTQVCPYEIIEDNVLKVNLNEIIMTAEEHNK
jgi:hypothetical protein